MKTTSVTSFVVVLALSASAICRAEEVFYSPLSLFKESFSPVMEKFFAASLTKTLRGFSLRGDGTSDKTKALLPSDHGISLDVAVRDAAEIPEFQDTTTTEGGLTKRMVRFPAFPPGQPVDQSQGLAVTLTYGPQASSEALAAISECIEAVKKKTGNP